MRLSPRNQYVKFQPFIWAIVSTSVLIAFLKELLPLYYLSLPFILLSLPLQEYVALLYGSAIFFVISVVFGAPPLHNGTYLFASLMGALIWAPAAAHARARCYTSTNLLYPLDYYIHGSVPRGMLWAGLAGMMGAYLGAAAIPLDWDRWWQQWPLPSIIGALFGYPLGYFIGKTTDALLGVNA